jgi:hypothetical protein
VLASGLVETRYWRGVVAAKGLKDDQVATRRWSIFTPTSDANVCR